MGGLRQLFVAGDKARTHPDAPLRKPLQRSHGAAKESNLPTTGLPPPAGFEGRRLWGFCACFGAFLFVYVRLGWVRFAEFGTRLGTRRSA
jgi:hypothetical protein